MNRIFVWSMAPQPICGKLKTCKKMELKKQTRMAIVEDFKTGTVLFDSEGYEHIISDKYMDGIWNTRRSKVVYEDEARFYQVEVK